MKKILIIDDEDSLREILKVNLKNNGFECLLAKDGTIGLEKAKKDKPDLIILDLMMPGISGEEVCKNLKSDKETSSIPIIMLTAKATDADRVIGKVIGADSYLFKPCDTQVLLGNINKLIGEKKDKTG